MELIWIPQCDHLAVDGSWRDYSKPKWTSAFLKIWACVGVVMCAGVWEYFTVEVMRSASLFSIKHT